MRQGLTLHKNETYYLQFLKPYNEETNTTNNY